MKPPFFQTTRTLKQGDFFLLDDPIRRQIAKLLPIDAPFIIWNRQWEYQPGKVYSGSAKNWQNKLDAQCDSLEPGYLLGMLVIPLVVADLARVAILVKDIDPALIKKMDHEWLCELRDSIQLHLESIRQEYVDSITGLYTNRLLTVCLEQNVHTNPGVLFLIGIGSRTRQESVNLKRVVQAGRLIETTANGTAFYLGGNIFGVLYADMSRKKSLSYAHRLLRLLKREGQQNVHIGISPLATHGQGEERISVLKDCWQALEIAERRGPYSLCEASYLLNSAQHPLARPSKEIISQFRRKWIGLKRFGLILVRLDYTDSGKADNIDLTGLVSPHLPEKSFWIPVSLKEGYLLVPDRTEKQVVGTAKKLDKVLADTHGGISFSQGVCHWPTLNYSKTETTVNCRKALMHGSFFGPGTITLFDHVSLNVSGDYYFDEGDYRQAVRDYRSGFRLAPDDVNLMNSLGVALIELNRLREAIDFFDMVLEGEPDNFMAVVNKGLAVRLTGNDDEALRCFERAARDDDFRNNAVYADISLQMGRIYCSRKEYAKAAQVLEEFARLSTKKQETSLFSLLGEAYAGLGENKKAMMQLQRSVRLAPHDAHSLSMLGVLYALEGQGNEIALSLCEQAVDIDAGPWEYWYRLAQVKHIMEDNHGALTAIQKCLRKNRKAADALRLAGVIYENLGDNKKSERMFERVRQLNPGKEEKTINPGINRNKQMKSKSRKKG